MLEGKGTFCRCGERPLRSHFLHGTRTRILLRFVRVRECGPEPAKKQKQRLDSGPLYIRVLRHGQRTDFLPVAPHSEGCESLLHIDRYRGIVEEAVFDPLGQRLLFDAAVEVVIGRIAARIEGEHITARPEACATRAPQ
jgi:hypothetical protein